MRSTTIVCVAVGATISLVALGCTSTHDLRTGGPAEGYWSVAHLEPQLQIENTIITGKAKVSRVFFIEWGDTAYADGVFFGTTSVPRSTTLETILKALTLGLVGGGGESARDRGAKSAAALKACESVGADIIVDPRYRVEKYRIPLLYSRVEATVRGRPAKILRYRQVKREDLVPGRQ